MIGHINNSEIGLAVRNKLNQVIDFVDAYNAAPPTLADILSNDNKTGGFDITSDDGNSIASIINGEIFLYSGTSDAGRLYIANTEAVLFTNTGGFYVTDGTLLQPNYFQVKTTGSIIRHVTRILQSAPQNEIDGNFLVISSGGAEISASGAVTYMSADAKSNTSIESNLTNNDFYHSTRNLFRSPINEFSVGGVYFISGIGIDTTATAGTDILNIGAANANVINYGNASTVHNFLGTAIYELQVNSYVEDKLITLNYGGSVGSSIGVGFEIEEAGSITGYFKTNATREGYALLVPAINHSAQLQLSQLTADRSYDLPDISGTLAVESYVDSKVDDAIVDGITGVAPSQNVVFDALLTKADKQNGLVSGGAITVGTFGGIGTNNDIRVASAIWYINPSNYTTASNTDFLDITLAATGLQRYVGFYGDNTNTITKVEGVESEYAVYPATPVGKALIGYVLVTDSAAASTPDLSGYMLIASKAVASDVIAATNDTKYLTAFSISTAVARYQNITITSSATPTIAIGTYRDTFVTITALAAAITSMTSGLSGTPSNGAKLWIRIKDNGTARAITWGASYVSRGGTLPTTTTINKVTNVGLCYNSVTSTWDCVAATTES